MESSPAPVVTAPPTNKKLPLIILGSVVVGVGLLFAALFATNQQSDIRSRAGGENKITINKGDKETKSQRVRLSFFANPQATQMKVANSLNLLETEAKEIPFTETYNWVLPGELGEKSVYAQFNNGPDDSWSTPISDSIRLVMPPTTTVAPTGGEIPKTTRTPITDSPQKPTIPPEKRTYRHITFTCLGAPSDEKYQLISQKECLKAEVWLNKVSQFCSSLYPEETCQSSEKTDWRSCLGSYSLSAVCAQNPSEPTKSPITTTYPTRTYPPTTTYPTGGGPERPIPTPETTTYPKEF